MPKLDLGEAPEGIIELSNEEIFNEFIETLQAAGASRDTIKAYSAAIRDFLSYINGKPLRQVTLRDIIAWRNERLSSGFPGAKTMDKSKWQVTLHYYTLLLRRFFKWLGLKVKMPGVKRLPAKIEALRDEEVAALLQVARNPRDKLILQLLLTTGLRSRELLELRVEDIDLNKGVIRVRAAKYGKERLITAPREVFEALDAWIKLNNLKPKDKLFNISYQALYKRLKKLAVKAGIDPAKIRPHILRHTFATMALRKGLSLPSLQRLLGHSDIRTTQVYLHMTIEDVKREYEEKMGGLPSFERCPRCGSIVPYNAVYCPYCGSKLSVETGEAAT
ncbi:MAG: tyrosine-type recombinase/integrase [Thermosphaera sp.]|nr:tyrosine-type recombinase/integrase [Thermosphaera sp.]